MIGRSSSSHDGIAIVLAALETARPFEPIKTALSKENEGERERDAEVQTETIHFSRADGLTGDKLKLLQWHFAILVLCRTRTVEPMDHTLIHLNSF
jgi:HEAT repeat protein